MPTEPAARVLIVDDEEAIFGDFARLLAAPPAPATNALATVSPLPRYELRYMRQGEHAVREVEAAVTGSKPFALAFVDLHLPAGIDGIETVARLWRVQPDLEIVLSTADPHASWTEIRARLTARDQLVILRKPFDPIEIRQLAAYMSEKWRRGRALTERVLSLEGRVATEVGARMHVELQRGQKFDALGRLAAGIAHEINTPTQYIQASLDYLGEAFTVIGRAVRDLRARVEAHAGPQPADDELDALVAEVPGALADAAEGVRRITGIVRSVRDHARTSGSRIDEVDINRQIRAVADLARGEYKHDAVLVLDLGELPLLRGHADVLGGAILNLLLNAAHAVRAARNNHGPSGKITITSRATPELVTIDIADTGTGIPIEDRERVFEPFYTTKPIGEGTGQGLTLARTAIVDGHHGTLTFDSEPGRGTTFHIRLPIASSEVSS